MDKKNQTAKQGFWKEKGFYFSILCLAAVLAGVWFYASQTNEPQEPENQNLTSEQEGNQNSFIYQPEGQEERNAEASPSPSPSPSSSPSPTPSVKPSPSPEATPSASPSASPATQTDEEEGSPVSASGDEKINNSKPKFEKETLSWPVDGNILNDYTGMQPVKNKTLDDWRIHSGIDLEAPLNAQVKAVADGIVEDVYTDRTLGCCILINHQNGFKSLYANLLENGEIVQSGDRVSAGDIIGGVGRTALTELGEAAHLHFELTYNGEDVNPNEYFRKSNILN